VFLCFRREKSAVSGNKNAGAVQGGGKADGVRKGKRAFGY
jgi:hypothetical protein